MIKHDYSESSGGHTPLFKSACAVVRGTATGYIFLAVCFAILCVVYTYTSFPAGLLEPFVTATATLGVILCGILTARCADGFGWLHGAAAGFAYTVIRCAVRSAASGGLVFDKTCASMLALGLLLGAVGGIIGINLKKQR